MRVVACIHKVQNMLFTNVRGYACCCLHTQSSKHAFHQRAWLCVLLPAYTKFKTCFLLTCVVMRVVACIYKVQNMLFINVRGYACCCLHTQSSKHAFHLRAWVCVLLPAYTKFKTCFSLTCVVMRVVACIHKVQNMLFTNVRGYACFLPVCTKLGHVLASLKLPLIKIGACLNTHAHTQKACLTHKHTHNRLPYTLARTHTYIHTHAHTHTHKISDNVNLNMPPSVNARHAVENVCVCVHAVCAR